MSGYARKRMILRMVVTIRRIICFMNYYACIAAMYQLSMVCPARVPLS